MLLGAECEKGVQLSPFDHYLYVLACGDGSLYTGYATDVQARLAAHQSGRGAKYTKSHAPVSLAAQARFYSISRAAVPSTPNPMRPLALPLRPGFTRKLVR